MVETTASAVGPLLRTAIIVSDLRQSTAFYRDVLGLDEIYFEGDIEDPAVCRLLGLGEGKGARGVVLKADGPPVGMIGLFELGGRQPPRRDAAAGLACGETCLVFNHADLDALYRGLAAAACEIVCPPTRLVIKPGRESREMTFRDPDGVMINCIERDP